jgi:hypothetical protein
VSAAALHRANLLLAAALVAGTAWARASLPERIPMHFGVDGAPTAWARTSAASWYVLPACAVFTAVLLWGAGRLAHRNPSLWNVPEKALLVRLSPAARAPIQEELERMMGAVGVLVTFAMIALQYGIYRTAVGAADGLDPFLQGVVWVSMGGTVALALLSMRGLGARIRAAAEREGIPGAGGRGSHPA